jgi:hypothetical protein
MIAHLQTLRRLPAAAGLLGLVLTAVFGAGAAAAASRPDSAVPGASSSVRADIRHDEAFVANRNGHCAAFSASHRCPFGAAASTSDLSGGHLIAIDLRWFTMDACDRGVAYFFDGTKFLGTTRKLRPFSIGGVDTVHAAGAGLFAVAYFVSKSKNTSCARNGNAGTDTYKYRWNGSRMARESGSLPRLPKVIVGSPADN